MRSIESKLLTFYPVKKKKKLKKNYLCANLITHPLLQNRPLNSPILPVFLQKSQIITALSSIIITRRCC
jgi:hypothetical protein